jgi:hypothetical protein
VIRLSFLSLALVLVPGAFLCVCAYLILKGRSRRKADRVAEEQARYLPRNPARDEAKKALPDRCPMECECGDRCSLEAGHANSYFPGTNIPVGCNHYQCSCGEAGTDEPSAPEEGRYHFAPGGAYVFDWSDPAHHYAWETGKALVYTASNGTTSTTPTVNNPGDQCAVSDQCAPIIEAGWPKSHPTGWQLVFLGAGNMLCAVSPSGDVQRYSRSQLAWISVSETVARMAREALGRAA